MSGYKFAMIGSSKVGTISNKAYENAKYLVIVPGHAVYTSRGPSVLMDDDQWVGGFPGEARHYVQHSKAGVTATSKNEKCLLVFSGGQTMKAAGPISEAQSYWLLSDQYEWFLKDGVKNRAITEDFARDSLEHLAFGFGRFVQATGRKPTDIIVCGWKFKEERYRLHANALGIRQENLHYVGVNNPEGDAYNRALKGEKTVLSDFTNNPLGNKGILLEKRHKRDPFNRGENAYSYYNVKDLLILRTG
jgi:hypothetical protein